MATQRQQRPAPIMRQTVTVRRRQYETLVDLYDAQAPVLVASASQPGFWRVQRAQGQFCCQCRGYVYRGHCAHVEAALAADVLTADTARAHRRPAHLDAAEYDAWLDSLGSEPPPDDDYLDRQLEEWSNSIAAARGPYWE